MQRIAIVGAGVAGITAAKHALEENLSPTIFEMSGEIGGTWGLNDGCTWPKMEVNISRYTNMFSDFPWDKNEPDFPTKEATNQYLLGYVKHFQLENYIKLKCEIIEIDRKDNQWIITWKNENKKYTGLFDALVLPKIKTARRPDFEGVKKFSGHIIHSSEFRDPGKFKDKKIVVIGNGHSGIAISEETAKAGSTVINLFRNPKWISSRYLPENRESSSQLLPHDLLKSRSYYPDQSYQQMLFYYGKQNEIESLHMTEKSTFGLTMQTDYIELVKNKKILPIHNEVDYFDKNSIILKNGEVINNIDAVILCTGYQCDISYLFPHLDIKPEPLKLYEETFPLIEGLAFLGYIANSRGSAFPILEIQARFAMAVFSGRIKLPSKDTMKEEIDNLPKKRTEIEFTNAIAKHLRILPDFGSIRVGDPILYHQIWEGAFIPAQLRLTGVGNTINFAKETITETDTYRQELLHKKHDMTDLRKYKQVIYFKSPIRRPEEENQHNDSRERCNLAPF